MFSMAIVGPWVSWANVATGKGAWGFIAVAVFLAAALGDLATYAMTSVQLALAYPDPASGVSGAVSSSAASLPSPRFPLAIAEGLLTVVVMNALSGRAGRPDEIQVLSGEVR